MALSVEVAEIVEHFQWLTDEESQKLNGESLADVADEIADVQIYLVRLADKLGVDILESVGKKMEKNELKYPVEKVKGSAVKYSRFESDN